MALHETLDVIYPRACAACGAPRPEASPHLCWDCMGEINVVQPPFCSLCGDPVAGSIDHDYVCAWCSRNGPSFDRARSAARYDGPVRDMLKALKYDHSLWVVPDLLNLLHACAAAHFDAGTVDAVAFVPLYAARRRERGFNQSAVLAGSLARRMRKPLLRRCLRRVRPTETQTHLTAPQRLTNVRNAFEAAWTHSLDGRRVLLVDDVMTTGATVNECARILKEGGAAQVHVVTVARG